jgi:hypothetical protein
MPPWVQILSVFIQLGKLLYDVLKKDPQAAKECSIAIKHARDTGDLVKLQQLLDNIKGDGSC